MLIVPLLTALAAGLAAGAATLFLGGSLLSAFLLYVAVGAGGLMGAAFIMYARSKAVRQRRAPEPAHAVVRSTASSLAS